MRSQRTAVRTAGAGVGEGNCLAEDQSGLATASHAAAAADEDGSGGVEGDRSVGEDGVDVVEDR